MLYKGKITDSSGEPLTGANVYVSDANGNVLNPPKGASADANGNYKFNSDSAEYITASFVGMKKQTVKGNRAYLNFVLKPDELATLATVEIVEKKYVPPKKFPTLLVAVVGFGLLALVVGVGISKANA